MVAHRGNQKRCAAFLRGQVYVRAMLEEQPHLRRIGRRPDQSGGSKIVLSVDVGAFVDQKLHGVERTRERRVHQRRLAVTVFCVHGGATRYKGAQPRGIVAANGGVEVVTDVVIGCRR